MTTGGTTWTPPPTVVPGVVAGDAVDGRVPNGPSAAAWRRRKAEYSLVSPANRRQFTVIVVGTGLAGSAAAAALGELGYNVECFTYHDSPRRAHSVAAQGGINAPRARAVDNDSAERFVEDTVKGGDFRGRESEAFRLAEEGSRVIDHFAALGAPFAREYGGQLSTRSFGGVQVSRTFYSRGQTGQQLQIASSQALLRQVDAGTSSQRATAPVAMITVCASSGSFWLSIHTRFTDPWSSTLIASSVKNCVPKRIACWRNISINFGPVIPSGKPG